MQSQQATAFKLIQWDRVQSKGKGFFISLRFFIYKPCVDNLLLYKDRNRMDIVCKPSGFFITVNNSLSLLADNFFFCRIVPALVRQIKIRWVLFCVQSCIVRMFNIVLYYFYRWLYQQCSDNLKVSYRPILALAYCLRQSWKNNNPQPAEKSSPKRYRTT